MRPVSRVLSFAALALVGCAKLPAPRDPTERLLFRDLERIVTVTATTGWGPDKLEVDGIAKPVLDSTCRVDPLARRALARWLDGEIRRRGGPVEDAYRRAGKDLDAVGDLLVLARVQLVLARAEELANDCPFWLEPEHPFRGRQTSEHRWVVSIGGGGKAIAVRQGDRADVSAGGAGRLVIGRAFADGHALYAGLELGASASFPKNALGERTGLVFGADVVAPLVYRRTFTNTYFELEGGYLARTNELDWRRFDHGVHAGFAFGGRALRTRWVFPNAAIGVSWERTFDDDVTLVKLGGRVTFDLDL